MLWRVISLFVAWMSLEVCLTSDTQGAAEYCQLDTFNASCPQNQVVLMEEAKFGRMGSGRCLDTSYFVGCYADVLPLMDSRCSGRRECSVKVLDTDLLKYRPCRKDLMAYLEAAYTCISVEQPHGCPPEGVHRVTTTSGYILFGSDTLAGTTSCPWEIQAQPGQKIEFSAFDFHSWKAGQVPEDPTMRTTSRCKHTLTFEDAGEKNKVHVCATSARLNHVYTSNSHEVLLYMLHHLSSLRDHTFILRYRAVGCADLPTGPGLWMRRNDKTAVVTCNRTKETWHLVCRDQTWIGELRNCTPDSSFSRINKQDAMPYKFHYGILIAIALGLFLGILLGIVMLLCMMTYKRRRRERERRAKPSPLLGEHRDEKNRQETYYIKDNHSVIGVLTQSRAASDSEDEKRCCPSSLHFNPEAKDLLQSDEGPDVIYSPRRNMGVRCQSGCVACNGAAVLEGTTFGYGRIGRPPSLADPASVKYKVQNIEMRDFRPEPTVNSGNKDNNSLASV